MVERHGRRKKQKQQLLGSHQKCWLWGRNVVVETLRARRWPILELRVAADRLDEQSLREVRALTEESATPVFVEPADALTSRCHSREHQGYLAKMPPYPYADADAVLANRPAAPLYAVLDSVHDPYNFGAILRSAAVLGVDAVFVAREGQCEVTSLVARTSAGGVNHLPLARVDDLVELVRRLQHLGITVAAATHDAGRSVSDCDFTGGSAIVIGNEGAGIGETLLALCDERVSIPQAGRVESLNAAVAAGILFYEARRQRGKGDEGGKREK